MRCVIIDDEKWAVALIEEYCNDTDGLVLLKTFTEPLEASHYLSEHSVDLIFTDIQMPLLNGMEFLKTLSEPTAFIFTTAHPKYAVESYSLNAIDFLLKPISYERFLQAIEKVKDHLALKEVKGRLETELAQPKENTEYCFVNYQGSQTKVNFADIRFVEANNMQVIFHLTTGNLISKMTLKRVQEVLPSDDFIRINRSYIVAKQEIKLDNTDTVIINGKSITIGERYLEEVNRLLT